MMPIERQRRILQRVNNEASLTVADLVRELNASSSTVRRDLDELAAHGLLTRVHGGAVSTKLGRRRGEGRFPRR